MTISTTLAIDRLRKAEGYRGWAGLQRYEKEILEPMVVQLEADKLIERHQQALIDDIVEHILHGVEFPPEN
jgi:hypothetical protein